MQVLAIAFVCFTISVQIFTHAAEKSTPFTPTIPTIIPLDQKPETRHFTLEEKAQPFFFLRTF